MFLVGKEKPVKNTYGRKSSLNVIPTQIKFRILKKSVKIINL